MHDKFFSAIPHGNPSRQIPRRPHLAAISILAACAMLMAGCHSVSYDREDKTGEKVGFRSKSFFTKKTIKDVDYSVTRGGTRKFRLKGYSNDQVELMQGAIEAALRAYQNQQPRPTPPANPAP